jgi:hypothetical protein
MLSGYRTKIACGLGVAICLWRAAVCPQVYGGEIDPAAWDWIVRAIQFAALYFFRLAIPKDFGPQLKRLIEALADLAPLILGLMEQFRKPAPPPDVNVFSVPTDMEPPAGGVGVLESGLFVEKTPSGATTIGCFALLLCLAGVSNAAPPKAVINGPTTGTAGELLTLDASQSEGENIKFLWRVTPDVAGRRLFRVCDKDPSRVSIASLPGTWAYTLVVSNAEGADLLTWVVTIPGAPQPQPSPLPPRPGPDVVPPSPSPPMPPTPGPGPLPTPTPGPTPPGPRPPDPSPEPPVPVPLTGFAADVATWVKLVISPTRDAEAKRLADACEATASAIAAGAHSGPAAILAAIKAANNAALGASLSAWGPFAARYTAALGIKYAAGELKTNEQWAAMLNETAKGLRGAK